MKQVHRYLKLKSQDIECCNFKSKHFLFRGLEPYKICEIRSSLLIAVARNVILGLNRTFFASRRNRCLLFVGLSVD